ncbi:MAG: hypothetical protein ACYCQJ_01350 [Nitrososphaerales archaeon]
MSEKENREFRSFLWVIVVLLIGTIAGIASFIFLEQLIVATSRGPQLSRDYITALLTFLAVHVILSTVSIALLSALSFVYLRIYRQTKARFSLGLLIVLFALLLHSILDYPLIFPFIDNTTLGSTGFSSPISDFVAIVAYTVFLFLSLE